MSTPLANLSSAAADQLAAPPDVRVLVVIVCYRAVELTIDCLRSLEAEVQSVPGLQVVVCENGTGGDAVAQLAEAIDRHGWQAWVQLVAVAPNRGFAGGNNAVLREVLQWPDPPEYIVLLNADTVVRPGCLQRLAQTLDASPGIGVVGPKLVYGDGSPQRSCHGFPSPVSEFLRAAGTGILTRLLRRWSVHPPQLDQTMDADWLCFACAMIRTSVLQEVGLLDEGFYLYFDDPDLCHRIRDAGWRNHCVPDAEVIHFHGQSNPVERLRAQRKRPPRYYYESRARYFAKYFGRGGLWLANLAWHAGRAISWVRELLRTKERHAADGEYRDIWTNWRAPLEANHPLLCKDGRGNLIRPKQEPAVAPPTTFSQRPPSKATS